MLHLGAPFRRARIGGQKGLDRRGLEALSRLAKTSQRLFKGFSGGSKTFQRFLKGFSNGVQWPFLILVSDGTSQTTSRIQ